MSEAASSCKISVITRMQKYSTGSRFVTSIWTVSDDRRIRLQHKRGFVPLVVAASINILQSLKVLTSSLIPFGGTR